MDAVNLTFVWPNYPDAGVVIPPAPPEVRHGAYNKNAWKLLHGIVDEETEQQLPAIVVRARGRISVRAKVTGSPVLVIPAAARARLLAEVIGAPVLEISAERSPISVRAIAVAEYLVDRPVAGSASLFKIEEALPAEPDPEGALLVGLEG